MGPECISRFCTVVVVLGAWGNIPAISPPYSPYYLSRLVNNPFFPRHHCCSGAVAACRNGLMVSRQRQSHSSIIFYESVDELLQKNI